MIRDYATVAQQQAAVHLRHRWRLVVDDGRDRHFAQRRPAQQVHLRAQNGRHRQQWRRWWQDLRGGIAVDQDWAAGSSYAVMMAVMVMHA